MRISGLTIATVDLDAQAAFWGERLGLPVQWVGRGEIEVRLGLSTVAFRRAPAGLDARYHFAINVPAGSIDQALDWLRGRHEVLALHDDPDENEGATVVRTDIGSGAIYFLDPGGNVVELISNPYMTLEGGGEAFGPQSLLGIAEIGIASADPVATRDALCGFFLAEAYWGGGSDGELVAVGGREAVVIVAPIGRGWIPVGLPARPLPTEIVIEGDEARELTLPEGPYRLRVERYRP